MAVVNLAWQRQLGRFDDCGRFIPPLNIDGTPKIVDASWGFRSLTKEEIRLNHEVRKKISKFEFQVYDLPVSSEV